MAVNKRNDPNVFIQALADIFRNNMLSEKWLIAPSRRIGFQWLDAVTRLGVPVLNGRVQTLRQLALAVADPIMARDHLTYLKRSEQDILIDRVFADVRRAGAGYLGELNPGAGVTCAILSTINDLRLSGVRVDSMPDAAFESAGKAADIRKIYQKYLDALAAAKRVDTAGVLERAIQQLTRTPGVLPDELIVIMPDDDAGRLRDIERAFLNAFPDGVVRPVSTGGGFDPARDTLTDRDLLKTFSEPGRAPQPPGDGTVRFYRAVGEVNEVREIFRRCMAQEIPFDDVEVLCTDINTYTPLFIDIAATVLPDAAPDHSDDDAAPVGTDDVEPDAGALPVTFPVTFADGIPARYTRPGRILSAWLEWIAHDCHQAIFVRMLQDGVLRLDKETDVGYARAAAWVRRLGIGAGRDRYLTVLDERIDSLKRAVALAGEPRSDTGDGEDDERVAHRMAPAQELAVCRSIRNIVDTLIRTVPDDVRNAQALLAGADRLLDQCARIGNMLDAFARDRLRDAIREMNEALGFVKPDGGDTAGEPVGLAESAGLGEPEGFDAREWLAELPDIARIAGMGPRAGCIHVASLSSGGHTGRGHTFIIGMDDTRFPGFGMQDPLILDNERSRISARLPTVSKRMNDKMAAFASLLARLRGVVTFGYCCRSVADDRDMFPGSALMTVYRIVSGNPAADMNKLNEDLPDPVSFAPDAHKRCATAGEWWLWRLCAGEPVADIREVFSTWFPHLEQGRVARDKRLSPVFTEYDGYVPTAGEALDPARLDAGAVSASRLETFGKCPMAYFFRYGLGVRPLEELSVTSDEWLDPLQKGALLHDVFHAFMTGLIETNRLPDYQRDHAELSAILDAAIDEIKQKVPPPNTDVYTLTVRTLRRAVRIFLRDEQQYCRRSRPVYLEVSIGRWHGGVGTDIDVTHPVDIPLPGGQRIRVQGRIDRIDHLPGDGARFSIWDYKTGSARKYRQSKNSKPPFFGGRVIQNALYITLAEAALRTKHPGATVDTFGYFFPNEREYGARIVWNKRELTENGERVLQRMRDMIAAGCYPLSDSEDDLKYGDYVAAFAFDDPATAASMIATKCQAALAAERAATQSENAGDGDAGSAAYVPFDAAASALVIFTKLRGMSS